MRKPAYWNHNVACFGWISRETASCASVLDVGCGDGTLCAYLDDGQKSVTGIDPDAGCIRAANARNCENADFLCADFLTHPFDRSFDAVIFVASLHHMDMRFAVQKAKGLLNPGGKLLIVGLAKPSSVLDYAVEALRVLPCTAISRFKRMKTSEENSIPVSYAFPAMRVVRAMARELLPGARLRYGLYYRYLLKWEAPNVGNH